VLGTDRRISVHHISQPNFRINLLAQPPPLPSKLDLTIVMTEFGPRHRWNQRMTGALVKACSSKRLRRVRETLLRAKPLCGPGHDQWFHDIRLLETELTVSRSTFYFKGRVRKAHVHCGDMYIAWSSQPAYFFSTGNADMA
jgi:hypothetical protein